MFRISKKRNIGSPFYVYDLPDNYFKRSEKKITIALISAAFFLAAGVVLWVIGMNM